MRDGIDPSARAEAILKRCVSIDLEIDPKTNRIQSFAGIRPGAEDPFVFRQGKLDEALAGLDRFCKPLDFVSDRVGEGRSDLIVLVF